MAAVYAFIALQQRADPRDLVQRRRWQLQPALVSGAREHDRENPLDQVRRHVLVIFGMGEQRSARDPEEEVLIGPTAPQVRLIQNNLARRLATRLNPLRLLLGVRLHKDG